MKLIDRYIFRSYLFPFICCMTAFSMLFVIWDLIDNLSKFLENEVPASLVATYYGCMLLPSMEYIAPAASLLGTLYALWNFTRANELTAFRASGISLYRIMVPFIAGGLAISVLSAVVKETLVPPAMRWISQFENDKSQATEDDAPVHLAYYNSLAHRQWIADAFRVSEPTVLLGVEITQEADDGSREVTYTARRAEYLDDQWWLFDPLIQRYDDNDNPIGDPAPVAASASVVMELPALAESPKDFVHELIPWEHLSTLQMMRYIRRHPNLDERDRAERSFAMHNRLAIPWACFVVTIFGIPAGARTGRQNALTGIFAALGFFFAYYILNHVGLVLGKSAILQPWLGAWLANMVFLITGVILMRKMR